MQFYLICYDIEDDGRRRRVARCLEGYGERVQESVFEVCFARRRNRMPDLLDELRGLVSDKENIRFYRLTEDGMNDSWTLDGMPIGKPPAVIIVS